jgi:acetolactate synthase-1/2/3 large subunit
VTGAEAIVAALRAAGVEVAFGLPGAHNLALWSAARAGGLRIVGVRHEQAAGYAADGFARVSGRVGVALVTSGPGAANTLAAVGEAHASWSPVLVVATDVPAALRRPGVVRGVLHETSDQAAMFAPVTRERVVVEGAVTRADVEGALALAAARSGPVLLQVPTDLLAADAGPDPRIDGWTRSGEEVDLAAPARLVEEAERPLLWCGGGARDAGPQVAALAERLGAPVVATPAARGLLAPEHPLLVGPPHEPAVGALWDAADLVVSVGSDLDGVDTQNWRQPQPPRLVAVNHDAADAAKSYRVDAVVEANAAGGCALLRDALAGPPRAPWADLDAVRAEVRGGLPVDAAAFLDAAAAALPEDAVVLADMCIPGYWLASYGRAPRPRSVHAPFGWGTLGWGFPAAIGAALAHDGPTVAVCGDGGFLFAPGELATVAQERPRLTTVVIDDGGYGMLRFDQDAHGEARAGVDLVTPDLVALARSFGLRAEAVEGLGATFGAALARHVADREPSVLVARAALEPPPTTTPRWPRA